MSNRYLTPGYYAVYEKEPRHNSLPNSIILGNYRTVNEAEQDRIKYGYDNENYYVDKVK